MSHLHPTPEQINMLGEEVLIQNPHTNDTSTGRAVAISMTPAILVETPGGQRMMLPLAWASAVFKAEHPKVVSPDG